MALPTLEGREPTEEPSQQNVVDEIVDGFMRKHSVPAIFGAKRALSSGKVQKLRLQEGHP